jgi:hypothetical protein
VTLGTSASKVAWISWLQMQNGFPERAISIHRISVEEGNDRSAALESVDMFVTPGCVTISRQVSSNLECTRRST